MSTDIVIVCIFFAGPIRGYSPGSRVNNFYSHGSRGNSHFGSITALAESIFTRQSEMLFSCV